MPVQLPQLGHGVEAACHAADDLAGGGPGVTAVVDAAVEGGGQVGFGHGEDFFLMYLVALFAGVQTTGQSLRQSDVARVFHVAAVGVVVIFGTCA